MATKYFNPTNHQRHIASPINDETDPEDFQESNDETDDAAEDDDIAVYSDEESPNFYLNDDEDIGLTVSEGEDIQQQPHYTPSVINYMPSQSPEEYDNEEDDGDDSSQQKDHDSGSDSMEQEEEQMIHDEFSKHHDDDDDDADVDDNLSSDSSLASSSDEEDFYDFIDQHQSIQSHQPHYEHKGDDDSYLWEYFFTTDSSSDEQVQPQVQQQQNENETAMESGESTDEETNLPPPSKRVKGQRAVEVLGANSQMRPPVLGSWNIENSNGNVGIIDGITTRTLSPPPQNEDTPDEQQSAYLAQNQQYQLDEDMGNASWLSDSDGEREKDAVRLDEFINTDEFDFDEDDEENYITTPLYRSRFNKNVPLSAFRNRSSPYMSSYDHAQHARRRRRSFGNNAVISPVRSLRKRTKPRRRRPSHSKDDIGNFEFIQLDMAPLFEGSLM